MQVPTREGVEDASQRGDPLGEQGLELGQRGVDSGEGRPRELHGQGDWHRDEESAAAQPEKVAAHDAQALQLHAQVSTGAARN